MQVSELGIPGSFVVTPRTFEDDRGAFWEWYRFDELAEAVGHPLELRQANASVSRRGVVRGIHYADVPPGQAKYVTVMTGAVLDFVVDIRVGSPTFGTWDAVELNADSRKAVYVGEGVGHAFVALEDDTTVCYLVSETFAPQRERAVSPLDPALGLEFGLRDDELVLSDKDRAAHSLAEAMSAGLLPTLATTDDHVGALNAAWSPR
ncbi:dTDP-4-dehydrorhamnose 3,5-epimerase [Chryseoglobus sp. 28M-23]|uniref:dTDP-4-dehydrorhamnose 3,5-epimerase family protein n=1 Tax=Chryseoglobus sp. 28M-23 TaxID=2772253 RepID=UPI0017474846|nr:dTDP-4-dehydrorhamnose 3,5-epimerase [Chryseoglobus sp. 28M-23]QOD93245.1 dTDP-4-dehydrorhamnose 3,5-epimerase family protein [Chryseoglobus sp. 28M-23]